MVTGSRCLDVGAAVELAARLRPEPARVLWPDWLAGREDDVLLEMGTYSGRPGQRTVVDIPAQAVDPAVDIGDGTARLRHPQWTWDALSSDGRLLALEW
jgi:hypothetical protein